MVYYPEYDPNAPVEHRWDLFEQAPELVQSRFDEMKGFGQQGYTMAVAAIEAIKGIVAGLELITGQISIDTTPINPGGLDEPGDIPDIDHNEFHIDAPPAPDEPNNLIDVQLEPLPEGFPELVGPGEITPGPLAYASETLSFLQQKILNDLTYGATGIAANVEDAIFKRNYERDQTEYDDEIDKLAGNWAKGGFPYPNGGLRAAQDRAQREFLNKRLDVSRDVMFKSWEYAYQNTHFLIQQGIAIEQLLIHWAESVATRVFEASKATVEANIRVYEARIKGFGEKTRLIIERAMAKIQYNLGLIRMYEAKVNAYAAKMKAEADRVNAVARGYECEVNVYTAILEFNVKKIELNLKVIQARIDQAVANAHILLKNKELEIKQYEALMNLKAEAEKAIGAIAAQVAAGALSAVHAQVSIGAQDQATYYYNPNQIPTEEM